MTVTIAANLILNAIYLKKNQKKCFYYSIVAFKGNQIELKGFYSETLANKTDHSEL